MFYSAFFDYFIPLIIQLNYRQEGCCGGKSSSKTKTISQSSALILTARFGLIDLMKTIRQSSALILTARFGLIDLLFIWVICRVLFDCHEKNRS
jgi:hypothetical protein